ncbi:hypothetical protein PG630_08445 [Riemerella anatipestifer]|nr:hypothetical protein [Riemerella anatipestifer]
MAIFFSIEKKSDVEKTIGQRRFVSEMVRLSSYRKSIKYQLWNKYSWKSYSEVMPSESHIAYKVETFTVKGYNSRISHYLVRFKRKIKYYSKAGKLFKTFVLKTKYTNLYIYAK